METRNDIEFSPLKKEGNGLSCVFSGLHLNCFMFLMMGVIEIFPDKHIDKGRMELSLSVHCGDKIPLF